MEIGAAEFATVRRTVYHLWWRWGVGLPRDDREELLSRVLLALVKAKEVQHLPSYTRSVVVSVLRVMRTERRRAWETSLFILAAAQQLPADAALPERPTNWGGARRGAGRPKTSGQPHNPS